MWLCVCVCVCMCVCVFVWRRNGVCVCVCVFVCVCVRCSKTTWTPFVLIIISYFRERWCPAIYHDRFPDFEEDMHQIMESTNIQVAVSSFRLFQPCVGFCVM